MAANAHLNVVDDHGHLIRVAVDSTAPNVSNEDLAKVVASVEKQARSLLARAAKVK